MASVLAQRVENLVKQMQSGQILEAFNEFYADNVAMQENNKPATTGKAANLEREKQFLAYVKTWKSFNIRAVGIDEQRGVVLMQSDFEFDAVDGKTLKYDQVAVQQWREGKIVHEKFYYDAGGK